MANKKYFFSKGDTLEYSKGDPSKGLLTIIKENPRQGSVRNWEVTCSTCSKDIELFPKQTFTIIPAHLSRSNYPCGCAKGFRYNEAQCKIVIARNMLKWKLPLISVQYKGTLAKSLVTYSDDDGKESTVTFHSLRAPRIENKWQSLFQHAYKDTLIPSTMMITEEGEGEFTIYYKGIMPQDCVEVSDLEKELDFKFNYRIPDDMTIPEFQSLILRLKWFASCISDGWVTPMLVVESVWDLGVALDLLPENHPILELHKSCVSKISEYLV